MVASELKASEIVKEIRKKLVVSGWDDKLKCYLRSKDFEDIIQELIEIKKNALYFTPIMANAFTWLRMCPEHRVRAILFIDCSHRVDKGGTGMPLEKPSVGMQHILDSAGPSSTSLKWAKSGVLIMPLSMTRYIHGEPHYDLWKSFISYMINRINEDHDDIPIVFMGKKTHSYVERFKSENKKLLNLYPEFDHNCKWSEWINEVLRSQGKKDIKWS